MSVAKNVEISATSETSFEDAIRQGVARATKNTRNIRGAWIKEQEVEVSDNQISLYKVVMVVTFVLE